MDKIRTVMLMVEKMNNDTRALGVQSGVDLMDIEKQVESNTSVLTYLLSNVYDLLVEKEVIVEKV